MDNAVRLNLDTAARADELAERINRFRDEQDFIASTDGSQLLVTAANPLVSALFGLVNKLFPRPQTATAPMPEEPIEIAKAA